MSGYVEVLETAQVDGATLTAAAAASAIPAAAKFTLPPNFLRVIGQQILIKASGRITSATSGAGTARFDVRFGATVVMDSQAVVLEGTRIHTNAGWTLEMLGTLRTVGAAANFIWQGELKSHALAGATTAPPVDPIAGSVAMLPWNAAPAVGNNFDATVSQAVDFFFTQTQATGSMTLHQYSLVSLNRPI